VVDMKRHLNRRKFIGTIGLAAASSVIPTLGASANKNSKLRILQIGVGGMGSVDRTVLSKHPKVEIAGLCDVDKTILTKAASQFPKAKTYNDCRDAFAKDMDEYDAVLVCTPDHTHAVMALEALSRDKHLYLQKPVVHQLDELRMLKKAVAAKPALVTQMGNQRSAKAGRKQAVEIIRSGVLGKAISGWAWTGTVKMNAYFDNAWLENYHPAESIPAGMNWDVWKNCCVEDVPYSHGLTHRKWRTYWEFGGGQLADWCCHLLDVFFYALDLDVPIAVQTNTPRPATKVGHSAYNQSWITFEKTPRTVGDRFVLHYNDNAIYPSNTEMGLPLGTRFSQDYSVIRCENGTLVLGAEGPWVIYQNGKRVKNFPVPNIKGHNHWHDWVDVCFGAKKHLLGNLEIGSRITEAGLLAVKATRFPNRELVWDSKASRFTNNESLNRKILKRVYRDGFKPPAEFA